MDNKRIKQLAIMFSNITGKSEDESRQIILNTDTGKAISMNNMTVMYEQQTENLYSIAMELKKNPKYKQIAPLFSTGNIVAAMKTLKTVEKATKKTAAGSISHIAKKPELKSRDRKQMLAARKTVLQQQKQNQINVRRIENANKHER